MPRREKDSLKTVQTQFCGHHTPNNQGQVSTQDLRQDSNDFTPTLIKLSVILKPQKQKVIRFMASIRGHQ